MSTDQLTAIQLCCYHEEKYQSYCMNHDIPCCRRCIIESHKECQYISSLDDVVRNIRTSNTLENIEIKLNDLVENFNGILENRKQKFKILHEEKTNLETKIKNTRRRINEHLDKLQDDLLKDFHSTEETENKKLCSLIPSLEQKQAELQNLQDNLKNIKQNGSDMEIFFATKQVESIVLEKEKYLQSLLKDDRVEYKSLSYKIDTTFQMLERNIQKFGDVKIESSQTTVGMEKQNNRQATFTSGQTPKSSLDGLMISKLRKLNIDSLEVTGCVMCPDGSMIFSCDEEKAILAFNPKGILDFKLDLANSRVFDITLMGDEFLAATSCTDNCIKVVNMKSKSVSNTILLDTYSYGITSKNSEVIYFADGHGIKMLNMHCKRTNNIVNIPLPYYTYVTLHKDKLLFTNHQKHSVICYSIEGKLKWEFKDEKVLLSPAGISTDNDGNVYVVGTDSNNLVVLTPDGDFCRQLLCDTNDLFDPWALYYEKSRNEILVANRSRMVVVYGVNHD